MLKEFLCLLIICNNSDNVEGKQFDKRIIEEIESILDQIRSSTNASEFDNGEFRNLRRREFKETRDCEDPVEELEVTTASTTTVTTPKPIIYPEGPLYNFIVNICKVILTKFQSRRVPQYFKVLSRSLRGLGSGYLMKRLLNKFRRTLWTLSVFNGRILKLRVRDFLTILSKRKPMADAFFYTANPIFTIWNDNKMDDYIYILKKYGQGVAKRIGQKTRDVFEKIIFGTYYKQNQRIQGKIQSKFKMALVEYMEGR